MNVSYNTGKSALPDNAQVSVYISGKVRMPVLCIADLQTSVCTIFIRMETIASLLLYIPCPLHIKYITCI